MVFFKSPKILKVSNRAIVDNGLLGSKSQRKLIHFDWKERERRQECVEFTWDRRGVGK
jgi:hypothetical protein